ncbi:FMN-dependent NADH-azoreductase [Pseudomonas sp. NPDC089554]|uniref:FMN-dependent NADH-azoreductase n=1 Tax=Pseudomonas sp. NPDC089554 TaxID=3390653 RepID=UPI003D058036
MNILHIDCSPRTGSLSRRLSAAVVAHLCEATSQASVSRRDLGHAPIPHIDDEYMQRLLALQVQPHPAMALSDELIAELAHADVLVIGTPMANLGVPSVFKAWIDQVMRVGRTIGRSPDGQKIGLLRDRPVYIAIAAGGHFSGQLANQPDFLTPYVRAAFASIGLHSLHFLALQGTARLDAEQLREAEQQLLASLAHAMTGEVS